VRLVPDTHEHQPSEIEDLVIAALLSEDPEEQREALVELTEHIDTLPTRLRAVVQEMTVSSQGEARLTYAAKNSTGLILSTPPAPLQEWSRFGGETDPGEWRNMLVFGDNLGVLAELLRMKQRGELKNTDGTNGVRVCYIDPPFATGREMEKAEIVAYRDKVEGAEFVEFLRRRLVLIRELLAEDGTLWVHLDTKKVHYIKVVLDEVFGEACFQSEVAWKRAAPKNFPGQKQPGRIKDTVLMYTRSTQTWVWNKQYIPYDADYIRDFYKYDDGDGRGLYQRDQLMATGNNPQRQIEWRGSKPGAGRVWLYDVARLEELHADGRVYIAPAGGIHRMKRYLVEQPGVQLQDMWLDINNVSKPRYPTEKPQMLLERVITASSNAGDLVLDCFAGSGSTLRAAEHLGRRWIGVDCGKLSIHTATRDLLTTPGPDGAAVQPFSVFHAGLYNPEALGDLDAEAWVKFVLDLFGASHKTETRHGVEFHGRLGRNTLVHVVDPTPSTLFDAEDSYAAVGMPYLQSIVDASRPGPRTKLAVVVPDTAAKKSSALRQTTYLITASAATHATEVRVLKVPPAITGDFLALAQPDNEKAVNALIDAHGFNVAMPPDVELTAKLVKKKAALVIKSFESNTQIRATKANKTGEAPVDGRDDIAMIIIDYDFAEDRFDFEEVIYGADLKKAKWEILLREEALTTPTMIMLIDRFGNEERRILTADIFGSAAV
jgi:hypothetical protein